MRRFAVGLAVLLACLPEIKERCPLLTEPRSPPPALPRDLALLDALLIRRAAEMVDASRGLHRFQVWWFRAGFAEQFVPDLCGRLERARALATAGRIAEAGRKYQGLLVASQVMQLAVAMHLVAQQAEIAGQPGGEVSQTLEMFAGQMAPILEAALSEDPGRIEHALLAHPRVFREWGEYLTRWPAQLDDAAAKVRIAKIVWDIGFLVAATYEAASAAAELAASGGPPLMLGMRGGGAAAGFSEAATIELAEAIRRLVAAGALDAAVVAALSSGFQMSGSEQGKRTFSKGDRAAALEKAKDAEGIPRCEYCGEELEPKAGQSNSYEADHRTPYSKGGPTSPDNLAPACRTCNRSKGAQTPEEWKP